MRLRTEKTTITVQVGDITVHGQKLTPTELDQLRESHTTWKGSGRTSREVTDTIALARDIFVRTVTGWENAQDTHGNDIPCTDENKRLVYEHDQQFAAQVVEAINGAAEAREDLREKN